MGCGGNGGTRKETAGAVMGGIGGAVIGSGIGGGRGRLIAIIAGSIIGALIGGSIGRQLDERDRILMTHITQNTLDKAPTGQVGEWVNPDTGHRGTIAPKRTFKNKKGRYCREFQQTVTIDDETKRAYGTACRQGNGDWKIVP